MKTKLGLAFTSLALGLWLFRWYSLTGYQQYGWQFPQIMAPLFHLDGESAEDADLLETLAWCIAGVAVVLFGAGWTIKRLIKHNKA